MTVHPPAQSLTPRVSSRSILAAALVAAAAAPLPAARRRVRPMLDTEEALALGALIGDPDVAATREREQARIARAAEKRAAKGKRRAKAHAKGLGVRKLPKARKGKR